MCFFCYWLQRQGGCQRKLDTILPFFVWEKAQFDTRFFKAKRVRILLHSLQRIFYLAQNEREKGELQQNVFAEDVSQVTLIQLQRQHNPKYLKLFVTGINPWSGQSSFIDF